ncbi:hypothetical protein H5410_012251 [Solanum commersonii]|uniref:Uncharacterized protein n=1 Tax=Solanum commersonii TaxID=4109 RepID=A0A9J6ARV7_SOLCO|nr:hypothetical protein H5410_012251 [Solanum commersonii]
MVTYYQCKLHGRSIIHLEDFDLVHAIVKMRATSLDEGIVKILTKNVKDGSCRYKERRSRMKGDGGGDGRRRCDGRRGLIEGDGGGTVIDWSSNKVLEVSEGLVVRMEGKVEVGG